MFCSLQWNSRTEVKQGVVWEAAESPAHSYIPPPAPVSYMEKGLLLLFCLPSSTYRLRNHCFISSFNSILIDSNTYTASFFVFFLSPSLPSFEPTCFKHPSPSPQNNTRPLACRGSSWPPRPRTCPPWWRPGGRPGAPRRPSGPAPG